MERIDGRDLIERSMKRANRKGGWGERHAFAFSTTEISQLSQESGFVKMLKGWSDYADAHFHRFETVIGEDYFLGPLWLEIGKSLRGLLNGEIGRLDGGTLDGLLLEIARHNGFTEEDL